MLYKDVYNIGVDVFTSNDSKAKPRDAGQQNDQNSTQHMGQLPRSTIQSDRGERKTKKKKKKKKKKQQISIMRWYRRMKNNKGVSLWGI